MQKISSSYRNNFVLVVSGQKNILPFRQAVYTAKKLSPHFIIIAAFNIIRTMTESPTLPRRPGRYFSESVPEWPALRMKILLLWREPAPPACDRRASKAMRASGCAFLQHGLPSCLTHGLRFRACHEWRLRDAPSGKTGTDVQKRLIHPGNKPFCGKTA